MGYISLDRKILNWEWYHDINTCRLFIHLLLSANHADGKWQGQVINRGQLITGLEKLSKSTGLTVRQLRVSFDKLKLTGEITVKTTNKNRIVTICKYDDYQSGNYYNDKQNDRQSDNQMTNKRQADDKQMTANNNNNNNNNNDKNINNKINMQGDFSSPRTPESVPGFNFLPDGRSYIEPTVFYKASDFNGLPEQNLYSVIDFFKATKNIEIEPERVKMVWTVFKTQELTEQKPYRNKDDVYRHFMNWCKRQSFAKEKKASRTYEKEKSDVKVVGVEFINNFNQCRMSDGSIQDLDVNQRDLAKYNHINPNSISKR